MTGLQQITKNYWKLRATVGYRDILNGLIGHLETLHQLLKNPQSALTNRQLCSMVSEVAQFIGAIYLDMGNHSSALACYRESIAAAKESKNYILWSTALGRMSSLPLYDKNPIDALPLLKQAQKLVQGLDSMNLLACLYSLQAEVLSNLQEKQECLQSLEEAERYTKEIKWESTYGVKFDYKSLMGYKGTCYLHLHQPKAASVALKEVTGALCPLSPRQQSIVTVDIAAAYVQQREIEEACTYAIQALGMTDRIKSRLVLKRLYSVSQDMAPWRSLNCVKDFEERIVVQMYTAI